VPGCAQMGLSAGRVTTKVTTVLQHRDGSHGVKSKIRFVPITQLTQLVLDDSTHRLSTLKRGIAALCLGAAKYSNRCRWMATALWY
jgi:hypothetical protein